MSNPVKNPPRILSWVLEKFLNPSIKYGGIGDFQEQYCRIKIKKGRIPALVWYLYQIGVLIPPFTVDTIYRSSAMLINYFKIGFRNILNNKIISLINTVGLALGIGVCLFLFAVVNYVETFNDFHKNLDSIYRVTSEVNDESGNLTHFASTPFPWAESLKDGIPEVENSTHLLRKRHTIRYNEKVFSETVFYTDPDFLDIFTYKLMKGDQTSVLSLPNSIVLTERVAKKYFDGVDPMGKQVTIDRERDFTVTGILEDVPNNSIMFFDYLLSSSSLNKSNFSQIDEWKTHATHTFLQLNVGQSDIAGLENKVNGYINSKLDLRWGEEFNLHLQHYDDILYSLGLSSEWFMSTDPNSVYFFYITAGFILLIAVINFMNLSTAKSSARGKEVGMRKVFGAQRKNLFAQFLSESFIITATSFSMGLVLAVTVIVPWYNTVDRINVDNAYLTDPGFIAFMAGFVIFVSFASGSYPALYLSGFNPLKVLKGEFKKGNSKSRLRTSLVVTQFFFAVLLIISNFIVYDQVEFLKNSDLGFDKEDTLVFILPPDSDPGRLNTIKNNMLKIPGIVSASNTSHEPGDGFSEAVFRPEDSRFADGLKVHHISIDEKYLSQLNIEVINGRDFDLTRESDLTNGVIVNSLAVERFEWDEPLGQKIEWIEENGVVKTSTVIGVTNDFHYVSLHNPVQPLVLHFDQNKFRYFLFKTNVDDLAQVEPVVKENWRTFFPDDPMNYYYLEDDLKNEYVLESTISMLLLYAAYVTIFIACLGLIGMASFTTEKRTKEIAVRKVLGSSVNEIVYLISSKYLKYVIAANFIAGPMSYIMMTSWLNSFANKVAINPLIFGYTFVLSLLIVAITISYQVLKAALSNPVRSLRYE